MNQMVARFLALLAAVSLLSGVRSSAGPNTNLTVRSIAAGVTHSLVVRSDGTVWAWGANDYGQLGIPTTTASSPYPVQVSGVTGAVQVATGQFHSAALLSNGQVVSWGRGDNGQLGNGASTNSSVPVAVSGLTGVKSLSSGSYHQLALLNDGTVRTWGLNDGGQLGNNSSAATANTPVTVTNLANVTGLAGGAHHSLAVRADGLVYAWGTNQSSQLGVGTGSSKVPVNVPSLSGVRAAAAGYNCSFALMNDGTLRLWGKNENGLLGDGSTTTTNYSSPQTVTGLTNVVQLSVGGRSVAVRTLADSIYSWGETIDGGSQAKPLWLEKMPEPILLSRGANHGFVVSREGTIWAWGDNQYGAFGEGTYSHATFDLGGRFVLSPFPLAQAGRFSRGDVNHGTYTSFVIPLSQQRGVRWDTEGTNSFQTTQAMAWWQRVQPTVRYQVGGVSSGVATRFPVANPIGAYGRELGGTPLYPGISYSFGAYAGGFDENTNGAVNAFRVLVYDRGQFNAGTNGVTPTNVYTITLPKRTDPSDAANWNSFVANGFRTNIVTGGLTNTIELVDGDTNGKPWGLDWLRNGGGTPLVMPNFQLLAYKISHTAANTATNFHYVIEALGSVQLTSTTADAFARDGSNAWTYVPLYSLSFEAPQNTRPYFVDQPQFLSEPLPAFYAGKSREELNGLSASVINDIWIYSDAAYKQIDDSTELRAHPLLDKVVADLKGDPLKLASFVINEIDLVDPMAPSGTTTGNGQKLTTGGVNRGALGVLLERQGSPVEQCALLVYLLRKAGYSAAYVWPTNSNIKLIDTRLSALLRLQVAGAPLTNGTPNLTQRLITVNYPWVVVNLGSTKSVQIFPWLKDMEVTEGLNVYDYLPAPYNTGSGWVKEFLFGTALTSLDPAANTPLAIFPKFIEAQLRSNPAAAGISMDDLGYGARIRPQQFSRWEDLPRPTVYENQSQVAYFTNLTANTTNYPFLSGIFNTLQVRVYSKPGNSLLLDSKKIPVALLNDRKCLIYTQPTSQIRLWLAPYQPANTNVSSFTGGASLTNGQVLDATYGGGTTTFRVNITYENRSGIVGAGWEGFLGVMESSLVSTDQTLLEEDIAGLIFNVGRVTPEMLQVHAGSFWQEEQKRSTNTSYTPAIEDYQGTAAYLMGMGYYERESKFAEFNDRINKVRVLGSYSAGLGKLTRRTVGGQPRMQGNVDIPHVPIVFGISQMLRPDLGEDAFTYWDNYFWLFAANSSAQEHFIINSSLQQTNAISTVKLLQLAQARATNGNAGILELNKGNYAAAGTNSYTGWGSDLLKNKDTSIWASISNTFNAWDGDYARVFITPGAVTNSDGAYIGMGAFLVGRNAFGGLISGNLSPNNGGSGGYINSFDLVSGFDQPLLPYSLRQTSEGTFNFDFNSSLAAAINTAPVLSARDFSSLVSYTQPFNGLVELGGTLLNAAYGWAADSYTAVKSGLSVGAAGLSTSVKTVGTLVLDPFNPITGEFYVDAVDLTMPGPFPLQLRRNYLSRNLDNNQFGYGWKPNILPYLVVAPSGASVALISAAEMDGSLISYRPLVGSTNVWAVSLADNPQLNNFSKEGIGSTANWLNARITRFVTNSDTFYQLIGPDKSERLFKVQDFSISGTGTNFISRQRPYLVYWRDNRGNQLDFTFGSDVTATDYGEVRWIDAANGNRLGFNYDTYGRILEAYTGDGRRVHYEYDDQGDLRRVELPDGTETRYEYEQKAETYTAATGFANTQGPRWYYNWSNPTHGYTNLTQFFNTNLPWVGGLTNRYFWGVPVGGPDPLSLIGGEMMSAGNRTNTGLARSWKAPRSGTISITSQLEGPIAGSDGVRARLVKNTTDLTSWQTVYPGGSVAMNQTSLTVAADDWIHFEADRMNYYTNDLFRWNPTITYLDGPVQSTHLLVKEIKPDGRVLANTYDHLRRVISQAATVGTDLNLVTNATVAYTNNLESLYPVPISGTTTIRDVFNNPIVYTYNNTLITQIKDPLTQTEDQVWRLDDETNAPAYPRAIWKRKDKRGVWTEYQYDPTGNVTNVIVTAPSGQDLDGAGNATATTRATYNTNNLPLTVIDTVGNVVSYTYSTTYPFLVAQTVRYANAGPSISTNSFSYTNVSEVVTDGVRTVTNQAFGLLIQQIRPGSATNQLDYDGRGWIKQTRAFPKTADFASTDPVATQWFFCSDRGEPVESTNSLGWRTLIDYDPMGRPKWREVSDGTGTLLSADSTFYNDAGEVVWSDGPRYDPEDYVWRDYDGAGRQTTEVRWRSRARPDGSGVEAETGDDLFSTTLQTFDGFGNLTKVTDSLGNYAAMKYDALGRLTNRAAYSATNATSILRSESFVYEPGNQITTNTSPLGAVTKRFYAASGRLIRQENPDGSINTWTYYLDGRPKREYLPNGSYWETNYDDANRRVTRTFKSSGGTALASEVKEFDARGNLTKVTDPTGAVSTREYDGLDRLKRSVGPAASGSSSQQITTYTYDADGAVTTVANSIGEKTISTVDALGRPVTVEVRDPANAVVATTSTFYSADHNGMTTVRGTGPGAVSSSIYTDTFGQTVVSKAADSAFSLNYFDRRGDLVSQRDELGLWTTYQYDALRQRVQSQLPDGAVSKLTYDAAGNVTTNEFPNGMRWLALYDTASRMRTNWLQSTGSVSTRTNSFTYLTNGAVGQVATVTDGRGIVFTKTYDPWMRLTNQAAGTFNLAYEYDLAGRTTAIQQTSGGVVTRVEQSYDSYGQEALETVKENGNIVSSLGQQWDAAGRRSTLYQANAPLTQGLGYGDALSFTWRADGLLKQLNQAGWNSDFGYGDQGLLVGRTNQWRQWSATLRDARGRLQQASTKVGGGTVLFETLNWRANSTLDDYSADRTGAGTWDETRDYNYNARGQLTSETFKPSAAGNATYAYGYDTAKLGVLTDAGLSGSLGNSWSGTTPDGLGRLTLEGLSLSQWFMSARGRAPGALSVSLTLDGTAQTVNFKTANLDGTWDAPLSFGTTPAPHTLIATATHPFNSATNYLAKTTNTFTASGSGTVTVTYDQQGNVTNRVWSGSNAKSQTLVWDELGRLVRLTEKYGTATNLVWSAQYDGLSRRYRVNETRFVSGLATTPNLIESWYDPQVEFLELAVSYNGDRWWKFYGPSLDGSYGGLQGVGGLEGAIRERDGYAEGLLSDNFGHGIATVVGGVVSWNSTQITGYGPVLGYDTPKLSYNVTPVEAALYRGHRMDATGLIQFGLRPYDPVEGRFLSPDPLGHGGSWSLYDYASNDPVNGLDPEGRIATEASRQLVGLGGLAYDQVYGLGSTIVGLGSELVGTTMDVIGSGLGNSYQGQYFHDQAQLFYSSQEPAAAAGLYDPHSPTAHVLTVASMVVAPETVVGRLVTVERVLAGEAAAIEQGIVKTAPSIEAQLQTHLDKAIARFNQEGFTPNQAAALIENPKMKAAFHGTQIDTIFKELVSADANLAHLQITPRFKFGPDVFDPANNLWYDVTTSAQWQKHLQKYTPGFGKGIPLIHKK